MDCSPDSSFTSTVLVIGGGPAGCSAAIQLHRSGVAVRLIEKHRIGGLLWNANLVENYPGWPAGISGRNLAGLFEQQISRFNLPVDTGVTADKVNWSDGLFTVRTSRGIITATFLILAVGKKPTPYRVEGLDNLPATAILSGAEEAEDICGKRITIIGSGDAAFDQALTLAENNDVTINNRSEAVKALELLTVRAFQHKRISYRTNHKLLSVEPEAGSLRLQWETANGLSSELTDYILPAVGRTANLTLLETIKPFLRGFLQKSGKLFVIGDACDDNYRQTGIAVGDGLRTAMTIVEQLQQVGK